MDKLRAHGTAFWQIGELALALLRAANQQNVTRRGRGQQMEHQPARPHRTEIASSHPIAR